MTNKPISEVIAEIKSAAESSTALNLDTAESVDIDDDGYIVCPVCEGDGGVHHTDYCNIDHVALGVSFYGIGDEFGLAEKYFRAVSPANVKRLIDHIAALEQQLPELSRWREEHQAKLNAEHVRVGAQYQSRITELEQQLAADRAHNVTNAIRAFVTDDDIEALNRFAECCDDPESGGHDLDKEQLTRLESIGALQRSGRISCITGFGDLLLSLRIPVEGE
ncbi:hypothetical protein [Pectobacterium parmentieri]|uniref:hypothetical protein n=1 Tax=Pectobacterium parmentieri TaxID=1905730 RepID=UPI000D613AAB|nr:hypothetical protein [Pectobacterium parmentieri]PWD66541.1 hypothetical protein DF211_01960 [Pectobacterium parmentieri]